MKKTFVTTMPDHIGAFLRASRCFAGLGVNLTRVSYNKAIDSHTLFLDAEGTEEQLAAAEQELTEIGYLHAHDERSVLLLEFRLRNVPGSLMEVLSLIRAFDFNISYISFLDPQETGLDYQLFKVGLFVENREKVERLLKSAERLCQVRVIEYDQSEKVYDNSIFYNSFVSWIARSMGLSAAQRESLLINTNLAMQTLDERGLSPYRTFDNIGRFAEMLAQYRGEAFLPRITRHTLSGETELVLIEPPCGSNTAILLHGDETLFVDSGYACYRREMEALFRTIVPGYDKMEKRVLITHADVDHCGLLPLFDRVLASEKSVQCLRAEYAGENGFREKIADHRPYVSICKTLTGYRPPEPEKLEARWGAATPTCAPLVPVGYFTFGDLHFEVYEGQGGHLPGELVLLDYEHHIAFTGDIYLNLRGLTPEQARHNQYAPQLMSSVDSDPALCARERAAILQRLGAGEWKIFGAHGAMKPYNVKEER